VTIKKHASTLNRPGQSHHQHTEWTHADRPTDHRGVAKNPSNITQSTNSVDRHHHDDTGRRCHGNGVTRVGLVVIAPCSNLIITCGRHFNTSTSCRSEPKLIPISRYSIIFCCCCCCCCCAARRSRTSCSSCSVLLLRQLLLLLAAC